MFVFCSRLGQSNAWWTWGYTISQWTYMHAYAHQQEAHGDMHQAYVLWSTCIQTQTHTVTDNLDIITGSRHLNCMSSPKATGWHFLKTHKIIRTNPNKPKWTLITLSQDKIFMKSCDLFFTLTLMSTPGCTVCSYHPALHEKRPRFAWQLRPTPFFFASRLTTGRDKSPAVIVLMLLKVLHVLFSTQIINNCIKLQRKYILNLKHLVLILQQLDMM